VHAFAAGELEDALDCGVWRHDVGCAEPERERYACGHGFHGDDRLGAVVVRSHGGAETDRALREDCDALTGAHAGALDRAEARRHHVGGEDRDPIRHAVGHPRERIVGATHQERLALTAEKQVHRRTERRAHRGLERHAFFASAAALQAARDHAVAALEAGHALADGLDHAHALVPHRHADGNLGDVVADVEVGAADGRQRRADEGLAGPRIRQVDARKLHPAGRGFDASEDVWHGGILISSATSRNDTRRIERSVRWSPKAAHA
jgi:hypothetical protein